jgi:predicted outer membrane repeat protein
MKKYKNIFLTVPFLLLFCLFSSTMVSAAVVNLNGGDFNDIQNGVNTAGNNGVLNLGNYSYLSTGTEIDISGIDNLTIQGNSNSSRATLDANLLSSIFHVKNTSSQITFRYINLVNGNSTDREGAGIIAYGTITVEDCSFINSHGASGSALMIHETAPDSQVINCQFIGSQCIYENATWGPPEGAAIDSHGDNILIMGCYFESNYGRNNGGAISIALSTGTEIINCIFVNNSCLNNGGAIHIRDSELSITNCEFTNNHADYGGTIFVDDFSTVTIDTCTFTDNNATVAGGAVYTLSSYMNLTGSTFNNNSADYGAALFCDDSQVDVENSIFSGNNVVNDGGAIYLQSSDLTLFNSQFLNNYADNGGSVCTDSSSTIDIDTCTFTNNHANNSGGALYLLSSSSDIIGSDFEGNNALFGGAIFFDNVAGVNLDTCNFRRNTATTGGALYLLGSNIGVNNSNFVNNSADYGSAIYNNVASVLAILNSFFTDNLAKTFDIVSPPVAGQYPYSEIVDVYLVCGDNIEDAIYNDGGSVAIDGVTPHESTARPNQQVTINISGIIYTAYTDSTGVARFNVQTMIVPAMTQNYVANYQQTTLYTGISKTPSISIQAAAKVTTALPKITTNIAPVITSATKTVNSNVTYKDTLTGISYWNSYKKVNVQKKSIYRINSKGWYEKTSNGWNFLKSKPSTSGTWSKYNDKTKNWVIAKAPTITKSSITVDYTRIYNTSTYKSQPYTKNNYTRTWYVDGKKSREEKLVNVIKNDTTRIYFLKDSKLSNTIKFNNKNVKNSNFLENIKYNSLPTASLRNKDITGTVIKAIKKYNGELTSLTKSQLLFDWVIKNIKYPPKQRQYLNTKKGALGTLTSKEANCCDQSHLLVALLRSSSVPAHYVRCKPCIFRSGTEVGHVWVSAYANGKWYNKLDTTSSLNTFNKQNNVKLYKGSLINEIKLSW